MMLDLPENNIPTTYCKFKILQIDYFIKPSYDHNNVFYCLGTERDVFAWLEGKKSLEIFPFNEKEFLKEIKSRETNPPNYLWSFKAGKDVGPTVNVNIVMTMPLPT